MAKPLDIGDPLPWISVETTREPSLPLNELAGRALAVTFLPSLPSPADLAGLSVPGLAETGGFWLLVAPPGLAATARPADPRIRLALDRDGTCRAAFRLAAEDRTAWTACIDPGQRIRLVLDEADGLDALSSRLPAALADVARGMPSLDAPVLMLPDVLEPALRARLIRTWESEGHEDTGYLRGDADGRLVHVVDGARKRRRDHFLDERSDLAKLVHRRVRDRVAPWIERTCHFRIGYAERYRIACYDADSAGFFAAHRDVNEHSSYRHFAMSIALSDDYEGGGLRFPEFGVREYRPPAGTAIVYAGTLLHEVTPVTAGRRFVLVNFLTNREGAEEVQRYQARHGGPTERRRHG